MEVAEGQKDSPQGQGKDPRCTIEGGNLIFKAKVEYTLGGKMN